MSPAEARQHPAGTGRAAPIGAHATHALARAWLGLVLPPLGWVADFLGRYALARYVSVHGTRWPLVISTAIGLLGVAGGAALCVMTLRAREAVGSARVLARWGLWLAGFFLLLLGAESYPVSILSPNEIT